MADSEKDDLAPEESDPPTQSAGAIAALSARGGLILVARTGLVQVVQIVSTLLIAHLLDPAAYGTIAVATTALGFARYVGDLGISYHLMVTPKVERHTLGAAATISLACATAETLVLVVTAPLLAKLLHGQHYSTLVIRLVAFCLIGEAFRFGTTLRLNRELNFARYGLFSLFDTAILYGTQIALLFAGAGVWSLVISQLARSYIGTITIVALLGGFVRPAWPRNGLTLIRRGIPYQGPAILGGLTGFLAPVCLAIVMDARGIGFWAWATVLATPIASIISIISTIAVPSLARLRESDPESVARAAAIMLRVSLVTPAAIAGAMAGFAHPLIKFVFGTKWDPALIAVILNLAGIIPGTLALFLAAILESHQRARERFVAGFLAQAIGLPLLIPLAYAWGPSGATAVSALLIPLLDIVVLARLARIPIASAIVRATIALLASAALAWVLALGASSLALTLILGTIAIPPVAALIWFSDRDAARSLIRYGVPVSPRIARLLRLES
jgi:O-antigen/teichoic acid export membrane protein